MPHSLWDLNSPVQGLNPGHGNESRVSKAIGPPGKSQVNLKCSHYKGKTTTVTIDCDHFAICTHQIIMLHTPVTNMVLHVNCNSTKNI